MKLKVSQLMFEGSLMTTWGTEWRPNLRNWFYSTHDGLYMLRWKICHGFGIVAENRPIWTVLQRWVTWFLPRRNLDAQLVTKGLHLGSFCLALLYNFPLLVHRAIDPGALLAYSEKVHIHHDWLLNQEGTSLYHFDTGISCGSTPVTSMVACDEAAFMSYGSPVRFGSHRRLRASWSPGQGRKVCNCSEES